MRIWFWSRYDPTVPPEIKYPPMPGFLLQSFASSIYPTPAWGTPEAVFPLADACDYRGHFDPHVFVFDTTFCVSRFRGLM